MLFDSWIFGFGIAMIMGLFIIVAALVVLQIVAMWKVFVKAGQHGWEAIIPFYNSYIKFNITWGCGWLFFIPILCGLGMRSVCLGWVFSIVSLVIYALTEYKLAEGFGHGLGFTIGLIFLPTIFWCILAFGNSEYKGIPLDGFSYAELTKRFSAKQETMEYAQPKASEQQNPNIQYAAPIEKKPEQNVPEQENTTETEE